MVLTLKMHTLKRLLNSYFYDGMNNHKYFLNSENITSSFILTAANYCCVNKFMFNQLYTSLLFRVLCDSIVQKINIIACSQVIDSHTTTSQCIMYYYY